jgi:hypothetical protein
VGATVAHITLALKRAIVAVLLIVSSALPVSRATLRC